MPDIVLGSVDTKSLPHEDFSGGIRQKDLREISKETGKEI